MESEALREVKRRREERIAADETKRSDWKLVKEAAAKKEWEVVRWVLRQGGIVDVNKQRGRDGKTLLHDACHDGDLETVKLLCLEMGADVGLPHVWTGSAAIHFAAAGSHVHVLRFLLAEGGADAETKDGEGCSLLYLGAHSFPVVRCLVEEFGAEVATAAGRGRETPLHRAARAGDASCLRYLLERGARLDDKAPSLSGLLPYAAGAESADALRFLVEECGCDPSALRGFDKSPLVKAAVRNHSLEPLRYLVEECGVSVEAEGPGGVSVLEEAAAEGAMDVAEYLVNQHGADPDEPDRLGRRPLHHAAQKGRLSMVKWLVQQCRVDVEAADPDGRRAVHYAALMGELPLLRFLVEECGVDVNAQTLGQNTPLHLAAGRGRMPCVRFLVEEADADVLLESRGGRRPADVAVPRGQEEIIAFLREAEEMAQMRKNPE